MNRLLGAPFWIAATIADIRRRTQALRDQDRAYRQACAAERGYRREQLTHDEHTSR